LPVLTTTAAGSSIRPDSRWLVGGAKECADFDGFHFLTQIRLDHAMIIADRLGWPLGDLFAMVEHGNDIAARHNEFHDVLDQYDGQPVARFQRRSVSPQPQQRLAIPGANLFARCGEEGSVHSGICHIVAAPE
jgi:hypothetical protein